MNTRELEPAADPLGDWVQPVDYGFGVSRRGFVQTLGAGLLVAVGGATALAQQQRGGGSSRREGNASPASRIHVGADGLVTVLTGKVEMGQGARAQLSQCAAEELRVPLYRIRMVMGDTALVPDDGLTAGSRTTPSTVPAVRQAAAVARHCLVQLACRRWNLPPETVEARDGTVIHTATQRVLTYAELARSEDLPAAFRQTVPAGVEVTPVKEWKVLGVPTPRPNGRDLVTGEHKFPSDVVRPGMLYGKVLRAPALGARLVEVDLAPAQALQGVTVVRDGQFVGVAAPSAFLARQALDAIARTAKWEPVAQPSSEQVHDHLRERARGGVPKNPFAEDIGKAAKSLRQSYRIAYVQHAPLEPRAAVAEWQDGELTVWTGTQNPFGYRAELARAFRLENGKVRVITPDFGSGFGGKHTGEAAVEAARLARAAGKPVSSRWTRAEEFTWAYFRPAAVIDVEAGLDERGALATWHFVNVNSGGAALETPYRSGKTQCRFVESDSPLRQGSYRSLAAVANTFARESFLDELAVLAGHDPLAFRLSHLEPGRLRDVLAEAGRRFHWTERAQRRQPGHGVGLACGTDKGSFVAACVEVIVDEDTGKIKVPHVCEVFECGAILNPSNLLAQVQGGIIMALGPALREEMRFADGRMLNADFGSYHPPRFSDTPELDIHLLDRPDLASVGAGETPMIPIAPAIANAVFHATGTRIRQLPLRLPGVRQG